MEEWKTYKLEDLCKRVCSGGTPKSTCEEFYGGTIPWLNTKEVNFNRIYETESAITQTGYDNSSAKWVDANSIIVAMYGNTAGKVALAKIPLTTNQACCNLTIDESKADYRYLFYYLLSQYDIIKSKANGAAQQNLNAQQIKDLLIPLPSLETQRIISDILSALDDKIELNNRINHNLEEQAQALYKSWFVDFEPFKDGKFVESELGMIPEGWRVVTMGEVTTEIRTKVGNRTGIKVLSPINTGKLALSEEYFTKQVFSNSIAKYILVEPKSFAYNPARVNIGSIGMNEFPFDGCVSPVYVVFRCEDEYEYLFDFFRKGERFKTEVITRSIGGVRQTLAYNDFSMIKMVYPPAHIIRNFNSIYLTLYRKINDLDDQNKKISEIRDTILPKLMSGELKINEIDC